MAEQNTAHGDPMPDMEEPHPFDGQFEPPAEAIAKMNPTIPLPEIAQASIAISLKRIADAIDGSNANQGMALSLFYIEQRLGQMGR